MIKISVFGDFCFDNRLPQQIKDGKSDEILSDFRSIIDQSDINIVNLEAPVVCEKKKKIDKEGPHLKCDKYAIDFLKKENFNILTLANNHIRDYGSDAIKDTIEIAKQLDLQTVGAAMNISEASKSLAINVCDERVTIINACESEFSIATKERAGANPINEIDIYHQIIEAKSKGNIVIVIIHGGHEYNQLPSPRMKKMYRFFIEVGADAVVGHHPHCFSGYEVYHEKPIFYSLGNFCFDDGTKKRLWNEGYFVTLKIENKRVEFDIYPYNQCGKNAVVRHLSIDELEQFESDLKVLNAIILNDEELEQHFNEWVSQNERKCMSRLLPYSNRYLQALYKRGLFPSFISKGRLISVSNLVRCEAHRDIIKEIFNKKLL